MNNFSIIGNLTRDPELKELAGGTIIANFSIAYNEGKDKNGEEKPASYFDLVMFGNKARAFAEWHKKGDRVAVWGSMTQDKWEDKDGNQRSKVKLKASGFTFVKKDDRIQKTETPYQEQEAPF